MALKRETLEGLLLDHHFGALPTETTELLDAYLEGDPEARMVAGELTATACLARQALAREPVAGLPKPRFSLPREAVTPLLGARVWSPWFAAAACLAVGFVLGHSTFNNPAPKLNTARVSETVVGVETTRKTSSNSFWSVNNLRQGTNENARLPAYTVVWDSPLKKPHLKSVL
jgi:hypothetical protein